MGLKISVLNSETSLNSDISLPVIFAVRICQFQRHGSSPPKGSLIYNANYHPSGSPKHLHGNSYPAHFSYHPSTDKSFRQADP